jgi:protein-S-isoprenylcysteine O-methyltransferase Ste14
MRASAIVTSIFLLLVFLGHLFRLIFQVQVMVNTFTVPMWMSVAACIVTAALAIWLWMDNRKRGSSLA